MDNSQIENQNITKEDKTIEILDGKGKVIFNQETATFVVPKTDWDRIKDSMDLVEKFKPDSISSFWASDETAGKESLSTEQIIFTVDAEWGEHVLALLKTRNLPKKSNLL